MTRKNTKYRESKLRIYICIYTYVHLYVRMYVRSYIFDSQKTSKDRKRPTTLMKVRSKVAILSDDKRNTRESKKENLRFQDVF